jgi:hypothetical protein
MVLQLHTTLASKPVGVSGRVCVEQRMGQPWRRGQARPTSADAMTTARREACCMHMARNSSTKAVAIRDGSLPARICARYGLPVAIPMRIIRGWQL